MTRRPARALSLGALISVLLLSLGAARAQTSTSSCMKTWFQTSM